jgi:hypothetical protein
MEVSSFFLPSSKVDEDMESAALGRGWLLLSVVDKLVAAVDDFCTASCLGRDRAFGLPPA